MTMISIGCMSIHTHSVFTGIGGNAQKINDEQKIVENSDWAGEKQDDKQIAEERGSQRNHRMMERMRGGKKRDTERLQLTHNTLNIPLVLIRSITNP